MDPGLLALAKQLEQPQPQPQPQPPPQSSTLLPSPATPTFAPLNALRRAALLNTLDYNGWDNSDAALDRTYVVGAVGNASMCAWISCGEDVHAAWVALEKLEEGSWHVNTGRPARPAQASGGAGWR